MLTTKLTLRLPSPWKWCSCILVVSIIGCNSPAPKLTDAVVSGYSISSAAKAIQYVTADSADLRISVVDTLTFKELDQPFESQVSVFVDPTQTFQTLVGIGGAITDASAETFARLSKEKQDELINAYYDSQNGIGYTLVRTHINSCDFSSESYTYVQEGDTTLTSFDVSHDMKYRIPMILRAKEKIGDDFTLFVSPWSPPAWMKDNGSMLQGGKLKPAYYQTWANYYVKFINAYEEKGIPVWGLTVQNEPMAKQTWESCMYAAEEERDFIKNYLGPTLKKSNLSDRKLIAWDHNRDLIYQRAQVLLSDQEASSYVWGMGFHWYEDWSGGHQMFDNVKKVSDRWPNVNLVFTEGCNFPFKMEKVSEWYLGERYGESMIEDFNAGTVAWTDWNILLDETGGPNHVKNFCFAPIHADTRTGKLIYTNAYYYLGHFSKFIKPGARRIQTSSSRSALLSTGFTNEDGSMTVIVMNKTDKDLSYLLWIQGYAATVKAQAHSIATLVIKQ